MVLCLRGPGASEAILAPVTTPSSNSKRKKPKPEHIDMLMKDSSLLIP